MLNREAVFLRGTTLMRLLTRSGSKIKSNSTDRDRQADQIDASTKTPQSQDSLGGRPNELQEHTRTTAEPSSNDSNNTNNRDNKVPRMEGGAQRELDNNEHVVFLSLDTISNESIARTVRAGQNDNITLKNLRAAYSSLSPGWLLRRRRATGIKFYRVRV